MTNNNPISINYSNEKLRILVEEYITQQRSSFTLQGVCSYILYWAMEDGHTMNGGLYESCQLQQEDCERVKKVLEQIISEERIAVTSDGEFKKING